ncbi:MAG: hypothetical protein L6R39_006156 [Caloplaca ligustica]|nr:MAG: hypothetical protein L6R39_006156 [Caloplaca ligustica]
MATIKAIEGRTVHQIQSGQVIVDLCSVAKELVENSLDAGATSIALKHYTSKLASYDDLSSLRTFGFRGEAVSSLCALSSFHIVTAQAGEAPKGTRLDFETSGKLRGTSIVASQQGTTVTVENLFANLPVRRRELEKNIKREYGKVLGLLQAYACISTSVKFCVSNVMAKGKKVVVFATKSNTTTRENIANVFGAKTLSALVQMDLDFSMQNSRSTVAQAGEEHSRVRVIGHVSRPVFGEGRQTPDRQMFFVNARPCSLPQFAKVFNEVYKSYNVSQSPFVFANIVLDTNAYDVNVSPDKRTILLHDQTALLESIRGALIDLFEKQDQTVPQTQRPQPRLPSFKQPTVHRHDSGSPGIEPDDSNDHQGRPFADSEDENGSGSSSTGSEQLPHRTPDLIGKFVGRDAQPRMPVKDGRTKRDSAVSNGKQKLIRKLEDSSRGLSEDRNDESTPVESETADVGPGSPPNSVCDPNQRVAEQHGTILAGNHAHPKGSDLEAASTREDDIPRVEPSPTKPTVGIVQNAFDRMRPRRRSPQVATVTIGDKTTTALLGPGPVGSQLRSPGSRQGSIASRSEGRRGGGAFSSSMQAFKAPGTASQPTQPHISASCETHEEVLRNERFSPSSRASSRVESDVKSSYGEDITVGEDHEGNTDAENEPSSVEDSDDEYLDDEARKVKQNAKVADLIQQAEENAAAPSQDNIKRAGKILHGKGLKDSTTHLLQTLHTSVDSIESQLRNFEQNLQEGLEQSRKTQQPTLLQEPDAEQKLSLTVTKEDFSRMKIVGQFNLGFILAVRPSSSSTTDDELFIIDQHASDEKYNFEHLQACTTVQNQRLVRPKPLELTAIEEEIIAENSAALVENGFVVEIDQSGDAPVGQRCKLVSLPMSKEHSYAAVLYPAPEQSPQTLRHARMSF